MFWGIVGMLVGVVIASQLAWPNIFYFPEAGWLNFGRLRPLHTSGVIFAFGGNALIATSFWVVQRTCRARLAGGVAPWFVFWGYQLFIVLAAVGYLAGVTQSREYAEPEWLTDLWLTVVWVAYLLVFLGTLWKRKEPHIYVANWFYLAFIVTIALLHLVNLLNHRSYSAFSGVQDALVQWWYGHNAVGFFLTAGFLAMMYYFVPKAGRAAGLFVPPVHRPLLGADLHLHLGGPAPPALHGPAAVDADAGHDLLDHAVDALLGRHDQRPDDALGRLGQAAHRPRRADDGRVAGLLRHVDLRRPGDVDPGGSTRCPTTPTGPSATCLRRPGLGRLHLLRGDLLPGALALEEEGDLLPTG